LKFIGMIDQMKRPEVDAAEAKQMYLDTCGDAFTDCSYWGVYLTFSVDPVIDCANGRPSTLHVKIVVNPSIPFRRDTANANHAQFPPDMLSMLSEFGVETALRVSPVKEAITDAAEKCSSSSGKDNTQKQGRVVRLVIDTHCARCYADVTVNRKGEFVYAIHELQEYPAAWIIERGGGDEVSDNAHFELFPLK